MIDREKKSLLREIKKLLKEASKYREGSVESRMVNLLTYLADKWNEIITEDKGHKPKEEFLDKWFFDKGGFVSMFYPYNAFHSEEYVKQDNPEPVDGRLFWSQLSYGQKLKFYEENNKQG